MINNGRKTIGVFITNVEEGYSSIICKGITSKAKELNYNILFFTSYGVFGKDNIYSRGEFNIINVPNYDRLDGIIIAPTTHFFNEYLVKLQNKLIHCEFPIVNVLRQVNDENYYNVLVDNDSILEDIVLHFIKEHKFKRINFLAGFEESEESYKRLESYKRILKSYNIPIEEERIYYGDFWKDSAYDAVDYFLNSELERPEAIVCANDVMAMSVCSALEEKGIRVPEDIAVSGCDDIYRSSSFYPNITTSSIPFFEIGMKAVEVINNHINYIEQDKDIYIDTTIILRESCGCKKETQNVNATLRRNLSIELEGLNDAIKGNTSMSTELTGIMSIEEVTKKIDKYIHINNNYNSFYLCLREDWQHITYSRHRDNYTYDNMILIYGTKNKTNIGTESFVQENFLPDIVIEDKPQIIFVSLLHHLENYFGYAAISYDYGFAHSPIYHPWLINISNALENIRVSEELNKALYKLEDLYVRDPLTGLYNRRGFSILAEKYLMQSLDKEYNILVFATDVDNLKKINDRYGHNQGDIVIKTIANALQKAADDDELCIRSGGDEFVVVGIEYNEDKALRFVNNFITEIENYNKKSKNPFEISTSYGYVLIRPDKDTKLNEVLNLADKKMYIQKNHKKQMRII